MPYVGDSGHVNGCPLDALKADLRGLGLGKARTDYLVHLVTVAHNEGYWEGVDDMMPLVGGPCDDCDSGDSGHDNGGNSPDPETPTGPGVPGGTDGVGARGVGDDSDNTPRYGASILNREDITPVSPADYIQGSLW